MLTARREGRDVLMVMNRARPNTRLGAEVTAAAQQMDADVAQAMLANRVVYAETLGQGLGAIEAPRNAAVRAELDALMAEISARLT